jgi:hypothetical protein
MMARGAKAMCKVFAAHIIWRWFGNGWQRVSGVWLPLTDAVRLAVSGSPGRGSFTVSRVATSSSLSDVFAVLVYVEP